MMAANLTPKGVSELKNTLDIVKNADVYEQRLNALEKAKKEADEATAKLTKAKDIDAALKQAKKTEYEANEKLAKANAEAAAISSRATAQANKVISEADIKAKQIVQSANDSISDILRQVVQKKAELDSLSQSIHGLNSNVDSLTEKIRVLTSEVMAKEAEKSRLIQLISDKQRKFKALLAE